MSVSLKTQSVAKTQFVTTQVVATTAGVKQDTRKLQGKVISHRRTATNVKVNNSITQWPVPAQVVQ